MPDARACEQNSLLQRDADAVTRVGETSRTMGSLRAAMKVRAPDVCQHAQITPEKRNDLQSLLDLSHRRLGHPIAFR